MTTSRSSREWLGSSSNQASLVVWTLSFGDLLTLLLCFFLVLTPWDRLKETKNKQSLQSASGVLLNDPNSGTTFASVPPLRGSVVIQEIPLLSSEWLANEDLPAGSIEQALTGHVGSGMRIEVLVCSPVEERARVVHGVGEALKRAVGSTIAARFLVTRRCDEGDVLAPTTTEHVGRIRVLGMF